MPWFGLGVWKVRDESELNNAIKWAIEAGYRLIDTASAYGNEAGVGKAIKDASIDREEIFVTTKLKNSDQGYESALKAFGESRQALGLEYIDLYLIHWPISGKYVDSWRALCKLYEDGLVRSIGVSNFHAHHLEDIISDSGVVPAVNQVECHPWLTQKPLLKYCQDNNIQMEAYSPLMHGNFKEESTLTELADKYGKSAAQIALRWNMQNEVIIIPKSVTRSRIIENSQIFDFELSEEDIKKIDALNREKRFLPDPDTR
ncbi:MAG: aldo/keto reductase [Clostridiales bacterium]|nr:aldo/keto reductase [Clostridiales bacterium]